MNALTPLTVNHRKLEVGLLERRVSRLYFSSIIYSVNRGPHPQVLKLHPIEFEHNTKEC